MTSNNACHPDQIYRGPEPFSEREVKNTVKYLKALKPTPILAIDIHAYGGMVLTPYGYAKGVKPRNNHEIVSSHLPFYYFYQSYEVTYT